MMQMRSEADGNDKRPPAPGGAHVGSEPLEELTFPGTSGDVILEPGTVLRWGPLEVCVDRPLPRGKYLARDADGRAWLVIPGGPDELARLPMHRVLPAATYSGPEGTVYPWIEGPSLEPPVPLPQALSVLIPLGQLLVFLEKLGFALVDLDPEALVLQGEQLRIPPRVSRIGAPLPAVFRPGYTPPEVQAGAHATGKEGVYILGGLLHWLLTGQEVHEGGAGTMGRASCDIPGVPQLLARCWAEADARIGPEELLRALRDLAARPGPPVRIGASTTVGLSIERPVNEDAYGFLARVIETHAGRRQLVLACVADGMGGMASGELAARAAVEAFLAGLPPHPLDAAEAQADWTLRLAWEANAAVLAALAGKEGGCTFTGVSLWGSRLTLVHVGDTRAYLWDGAGLRPITRDHSLVAALVASGMMTPEEARSSPDRNKVLRSLGALRQRQENYIDLVGAGGRDGPQDLAPGQALILVTDGIWAEVAEADMSRIIREKFPDPQAIADALVQASIAAGAPDNATALVILVPEV
ncbi:MAG: hypothetical protein C4299_03635 [Thermoleophilia bacterium]